MLHFHYSNACVVFPDFATSFPFPCGVREEAEEVMISWGKWISETKREKASSFCVELVHHGYLFVLEREGAARIWKEWEEALSLLDKVNPQLFLRVIFQSCTKSRALYPIFQSASIIGVVEEDTESQTCRILVTSKVEDTAVAIKSRVLKALLKKGNTTFNFAN